ncbi:unnamed protein product [Trichogramma brassicae]|uniref:Uncharacterized protein n=1 Tax=Trichogramma brassicae TaxID=86971 RepID=A0A6H5IBX6_9HYME|nr:unnamed protein product [Trichogramma brassicae]
MDRNRYRQRKIAAATMCAQQLRDSRAQRTFCILYSASEISLAITRSSRCQSRTIAPFLLLLLLLLLLAVCAQSIEHIDFAISFNLREKLKRYRFVVLVHPQGAATLLGLGRRRGGPVGAAATAPAHDGRSAVLDQVVVVAGVLRKSSQFVSRGFAPTYTRGSQRSFAGQERLIVLTHRGSLEVELVSTLLLLLLRLDAVVSRCRPKRRNDSCAPQCRASAAACSSSSSSSSNGIFVFDKTSATCIRGKPGSIRIRCRTRRSRTRFRVQKKTREFPV